MTEFDLQGIGMTSQRTRDRLVARLREQGIDNTEVLACMGIVPRHIFVDEAMAHRAYEDTALPIGHNQTISQPFIVALMSQLLSEVKPQQVLEVGTGSGYQTAVLAQLCKRLYSIERISALTTRAKRRLAAMSIKNVSLATRGKLVCGLLVELLQEREVGKRSYGEDRQHVKQHVDFLFVLRTVLQQALDDKLRFLQLLNRQMLLLREPLLPFG